jgi:hypothetical protein
MMVRRFPFIAPILLILSGLAQAQTPDSGKTATVPQAVSSHTVDSSKLKAGQPEAQPGSAPDLDTIFSPDDYVVIEAHHRLFPSFQQTDTVKFHQRFQLGDENLFAEVFKFVADLKVSMKGEKVKMSDTLNNPAVQVRVISVDSITHKDSVMQETWAFYYSGAPHFSRTTFFAFTLKSFKVSNPKYIKPPEGK